MTLPPAASAPRRMKTRRPPLVLPASVRASLPKEAPSVTAARLVLALLRQECPPTGEGVAEYLQVYRSTAFRLLSRLVAAGILTRRKERRDRIPPLWVYAVAEGSVDAPKKSIEGDTP